MSRELKCLQAEQQVGYLLHMDLKSENMESFEEQEVVKELLQKINSYDEVF